MADTKSRVQSLLGPVLGYVEKSAPNQVTGKKLIKKFFIWETDRSRNRVTKSVMGHALPVTNTFSHSHMPANQARFSSLVPLRLLTIHFLQKM